MIPLNTLCAAKLTNLPPSSFQKLLKRLLHVPIAYDTRRTRPRGFRQYRASFVQIPPPSVNLFSCEARLSHILCETGSARLGCGRKTLCTACIPKSQPGQKGKTFRRITTIWKRHNASMKLPIDAVKEIDNTTWKVQSSDGAQYYTITFSVAVSERWFSLIG